MIVKARSHGRPSFSRCLLVITDALTNSQQLWLPEKFHKNKLVNIPPWKGRGSQTPHSSWRALNNRQLGGLGLFKGVAPSKVNDTCTDCFFLNLTQTRVFKEEGASVEGMPT